MAFCGKCGTKNPDGAAFCIECGAPLMRAADAAPVNQSRRQSSEPSQEPEIPRQGGRSRQDVSTKREENATPRQESTSSSGFTRVPLRRETAPPPPPPRRESESESPLRQYEPRSEEEPPRRPRYRDEEEQPRRRRYRDEDEYDDEYDDDAPEGGGFVGNLVSLAKRSALTIAIGAVAMFLIMWAFNSCFGSSDSGSGSDSGRKGVLVRAADFERCMDDEQLGILMERYSFMTSPEAIANVDPVGPREDGSYGYTMMVSEEGVNKMNKQLGTSYKAGEHKMSLKFTYRNDLGNRKIIGTSVLLFDGKNLGDDRVTYLCYCGKGIFALYEDSADVGRRGADNMYFYVKPDGSALCSKDGGQEMELTFDKD